MQVELIISYSFHTEIDSVQDVTANRKRDTTLKPQLTLNRDQGKKLVVEYNDKGKLMGEASMELTSYLGFLGRTMVPMVYEDWRQVPDELKENLWDCVQVCRDLVHSRFFLIE